MGNNHCVQLHIVAYRLQRDCVRHVQSCTVCRILIMYEHILITNDYAPASSRPVVAWARIPQTVKGSFGARFVFWCYFRIYSKNVICSIHYIEESIRHSSKRVYKATAWPFTGAPSKARRALGGLGRWF